MSTKEIIALSVRSENYNSNNAWGFGGKSGIYYFFSVPGLRYFRGRFSYRHGGPGKMEDLYYFEGRSIEKKEFLEILNK